MTRKKSVAGNSLWEEEENLKKDCSGKKSE